MFFLTRLFLVICFSRLFFVMLLSLASSFFLSFWDSFQVTKASSGRAKLEFLFTKIGVGSKLIWPRDRIDISKERALHPPPPLPPPPQKKVIESIMTPPPPWD